MAVCAVYFNRQNKQTTHRFLNNVSYITDDVRHTVPSISTYVYMCIWNTLVSIAQTEQQKLKEEDEEKKNFTNYNFMIYQFKTEQFYTLLTLCKP